MTNVFNQSEFILSLYGKSSKELKDILMKSIEDAIEHFKNLYTNNNDNNDKNENEYTFEKMKEKFELFKYGYVFINRMNQCIDLLSIIEENETKRLMYTECIKHTLKYSSFIGDIELEYREIYKNDINTISNYTDILKNNPGSEMIKKFLENSEFISKRDHTKAVNQFNHNINLILTQMVKLKTTLDKAFKTRALY